MGKRWSSLMGLLALLWVISMTPHAWSQAYPAKPILITVGLQVATGSDIAVRMLVERMSPLLGQQIVIENLPGASGIVAAVKVVKAAPDGYSLVALSTAALTILPNLEPKPPYDPLRDFAPVTLAVSTPGLFFSPADSMARA